MKFRAGMLVSTEAGNYVFRLVSPSHLKPGWAVKTKSVKRGNEMWHVDILFDASGKSALGSSIVTDVENFVPFDAKRLGLLWLSINDLIAECRRTWQEHGTEEEGQEEQARQGDIGT